MYFQRVHGRVLAQETGAGGHLNPLPIHQDDKRVIRPRVVSQVLQQEPQQTHNLTAIKRYISLSNLKDFSTNLTFKTLSLGFYITANDIWTRTFKKYQQEVVEKKFESIDLGKERKLGYFATLEVGLFGMEKWFRQEEGEV